MCIRDRYLDMASLIGKKQDGKTYYYLAESARVNGKPRIVSQRYLGSAEEIAARLSEAGPGEPVRSRHLSFGDLAAAVWSVLSRLGVVDIIDDVVGSRRADAGARVGTYIALATLNRIVAPCSKLAFSESWDKTAADRLVRLPAASRDHRRFWDAMDAITPTQLTEIERRIGERMVTEFSLDLSGLVLDMTNFATFIDSANEKAPIAQPGHAKQKRGDLRLVGLGLVVSTDGGIPLAGHAYAGNRHDNSQFQEMVGELTHRWGALAASSDDLTLVYDAGQDSEANQAAIAQSPLHFVGSLPPSKHAETLAKAMRQLGELAERLGRGKTRKDRAGVEAEIASITKTRWVSRVITTALIGSGPSDFSLTVAIDAKARGKLEDELFGKRILFTDRDDWPLAEIVAAYRSQWTVESDFRQMKDREVVSFSPMFHWTDQKIRVHAFYCVLALAVARLMEREAKRAGLDMSVRRLLGALGDIQETVLLYQGERGRPRARRMLTEMDPTQQRLYDLFGLDEYAPKR